MNNQGNDERKLREHALSEAVISKSDNEARDDVVKRAEAYYAFLKGGES